MQAPRGAPVRLGGQFGRVKQAEVVLPASGADSCLVPIAGATHSLDAEAVVDSGAPVQLVL